MVFPRFPRDFPPLFPSAGAGHHRGVGAGAAEASRRPRQVVGQGAGPGAAARPRGAKRCEAMRSVRAGGWSFYGWRIWRNDN